MVFAAGVLGVSRDAASFPFLVLSTNNPSSFVSRLCRESKVLSRFCIGFVFVLLVCVAFTFLAFAFAFALLVVFAILAFAFAKHKDTISAKIITDTDRK